MEKLLTFYRSTWQGAFDGTDEELSVLLSRAADVIDNEIYLSGETVEDIPEMYSNRVYKAVCAQAEYIESSGGADGMNDVGYSSVSLGKFSYSGGSGESSGASCTVCQQARQYLLPTGLLYKGAIL